MIDENLPIFYMRPPKEKGVFDTQILLSEQGAEATPAYILRRLDPSSPVARNKYAIALYDAYAPDVLYGEVFLEPDWSQPSLSMDAIRANGGVAPPPQPSLPNEFTIQLYSPEQQIKIRHVPSSWTSTASWEFAMPQESFRRPSASALDRTGDDPLALSTTPMINMLWKRTGKLSKDLMCYLTSKSQNPDGSRRKQREPDIPLSFFHHFSELTVYEPNVTRLDIEDPKGFEVATLLAAATIRDVYFNSLREAFHIYELDIRGTPQSPTRQRAGSSPTATQPGQNLPTKQPNPPTAAAAATAATATASANSTRPPVITTTPPVAGSGAEARRQMEIEAETAQIRFQLGEEERQRQRQEYEDSQRAKRLMREEEKAEQKRRQEIEKETARLRKEWESERARLRKEDRPALPPRLKEDKSKKREKHHHHHSHNSPNGNSQQPYLGPPEPDINTPAGVFGPQVTRPKSSLGGGLNIFRSSDDKERKMLKKKSTIW